MSTVGVVLKKGNYAAIAAIVSITLGAVFWLLTFYFTPTPLPDYIKMYGMPFTVTTVTLGSAIAILTGINTSLIIYRKRVTGSLGFRRGAGSNACGAFTGALASGCPVCTMPLLGVFGLGGALALFPLQGLELKMVAIAVLGVSLYFTAKNAALQTVSEHEKHF
ncbi:MAG: hypothetical protein HY295_06890 [Thaumarchaeota archaeon]|nr:hypothetical protein [Nitrososphaerota archaeon]